MSKASGESLIMSSKNKIELVSFKKNRDISRYGDKCSISKPNSKEINS